MNLQEKQPMVKVTEPIPNHFNSPLLSILILSYNIYQLNDSCLDYFIIDILKQQSEQQLRSLLLKLKSVMQAGNKTKEKINQCGAAVKQHEDSMMIRNDDNSGAAKHHSYSSPANDQNSSKFDNSNTLANLLMFESGAYEQSQMTHKRADRHSMEVENVLEEYNENSNLNGQYPEYYKDNRGNINEDEYSEQSQDNLCNFLLKLFGILAFQIRILQRETFQKMFIEASRKVMISKSELMPSKYIASSPKKEADQNYNFSKLKSTDTIFPIKEQTQSQINKRQSQITFRNLHSQQNHSATSSQFKTGNPSEIKSQMKQEANSSPFCFNSSIKRKTVTNSFQSVMSEGKKVEIETFENNSKKTIVNIKQEDTDSQTQAIKMDEWPLTKYALFNERLEYKKVEQIQQDRIQQCQCDNEHDNEDILQIMDNLRDLSSCYEDPSSSSENLKVFENNNIMIYYEADEQAPNNSPRQNTAKNIANSYSQKPFSPIKNPHITQIKESLYIPNNSLNRHQFQALDRPKTKFLQNRHIYPRQNSHLYPQSRPVTQLVNPSNIQYGEKIGVNTSKINNFQDYGPSVPSSQHRHDPLPQSPVNQRPFSCFNHKSSFNSPSPIIKRNPHPQIIIKYSSPMNNRPKSQQPRFLNRTVSNPILNQRSPPSNNSFHSKKSPFIQQYQQNQIKNSPNHHDDPYNFKKISHKVQNSNSFSIRPTQAFYRNTASLTNNLTVGSQSLKMSPNLRIQNENPAEIRKNPELVINDLFSEQNSHIRSPPKSPDTIIKAYYDFDIPKASRNRKKLEVISKEPMKQHHRKKQRK